MQDICCKFGRAAAVVAVVMAFASSMWAGEWKVTNVVLCFGDGTCQVVDTSTNPVTVLDQIADSAAITSPGSTRGVAINNTLHLLVSDAASGNNQANVVEYQIAGKDPLGNNVTHGVSTVFNQNGPGNAAAVALDNAGDMFILNATNPPNITEINAGNQFVKSIDLSSCATQVSSMDLSADSSTAYVTAGGTIQKVNLSSGACTPFASFGSGVNLFGIRDIPAGALSTCKTTSCTDETVLVVAKGFIDPNTGENEGASDASDAVNICTDAVDQTPVSCALLLDVQTTGPGILTSPTWQAGHLFNPKGSTILDPFLQVESVYTPGTSGADEPAWGPTGTHFRDNAVVWTDQGQKLWQPNFVYAVGNIIVDPAGHIQQVTKVRGTALSGTSEPAWSEVCGSTTTDNKVTWTDTCGWIANHAYAVNAQVGSPSAAGRHLELATTAGISGPIQPTWISPTTVDGLQWQNMGLSPAVLARYMVTGQTNLQALAIDPLIAQPAAQTCSNGNCSATGRKINNFWIADSASGNFFRLDFVSGTPVSFSATVPTCTGCTGIESIGLYGAEDAAQPGLVALSVQSLTGTGTTNSGTFSFAPDTSDNHTLQVTGYNFASGTTINITGYASAINAGSGVSDALLTPTPPPNPPLTAPAAACTATTTPPTGIAPQCVVWELDNDILLPTCTNPPNCAFLGVQLEYPLSGNPNFNVLAAIDEQYDVTDSVDTISHYTNSQISLHNSASTTSNASCTYGSPLSPSFSSPPTCLTTSRNNVPFKFQCTNMPTGTTQANLLPFLHIVQSVAGPSGTTQEPLLVLNGTGGTTNYRFDTTGQQWVFNLNNPGLGNYLACTEDATHKVPDFCTFFNIQNSCP